MCALPCTLSGNNAGVGCCARDFWRVIRRCADIVPHRACKARCAFVSAVDSTPLVSPGIVRRGAPLLAIQVLELYQSAMSCPYIWTTMRFRHTVIALSVCYVDVWAV